MPRTNQALCTLHAIPPWGELHSNKSGLTNISTYFIVLEDIVDRNYGRIHFTKIFIKDFKC